MLNIYHDIPSVLDFDSIFNDIFESTNDRYPRVDVYEEKDSYTVEAEVPGYKDEDIEIMCHQGVLSISGKGEEKKEDDKNRVIFSETSRPEFKRSFQLPDDINEDEISASSRNGILTIRIGKKAEAQPRKITVNIN